jgi:Zn-finger nucleic acid-binding protein
VEQWHPDNLISPESITATSPKQVKWICPESHVWISQVKHRAIRRPECPKCNQGAWGKSGIEDSLINLLGDHFNCVGQKTFDDLKWSSGRRLTVDALLTDVNCIVEYDGLFWHKDKVDSDIFKTVALLDAGYKVIRLRENQLPHLEITHPNLLQMSVTYSLDINDLSHVVDDIKSFV